MMPSVTVGQLQQALAQPNAALKKRALAIIFNESIVEARGILEEYVGRETQPDLQALGIKVLKKLEGFAQSSTQVEPDRLSPMLSRSSPEERLVALRALIGRRSPDIAGIIHRTCSQENTPETDALVAEILRINPDSGNLPFLMRFMGSPSEKIRMDALEGMLNFIYGCLYPHILKSLLDPSPPMKMKAYQLISKISRTNLIEALDFMLGNSTLEMARTAAQLLPSFVNPDLVPLLTRHMSHSDTEVSAACIRVLVRLSQRGCADALNALENLAPDETASQQGAPGKAPVAGAPGKAGTRAPTPDATALQSFSPNHISLLERFPRIICEPLTIPLPSTEARFAIARLRDFYARLCDVLIFTFILTYFQFGRRNNGTDRMAFQAIQAGRGKIEPVMFLRSVAATFPAPDNESDLFPIVVGHTAVNDYADSLFEEMLSIQQGWDLLDENPDQVTHLLKPAISSLEKIIISLAPLVTNRVAVKSAAGEGVHVEEVWNPKGGPIDPRILTNFDLVTNQPFLISRNSNRGVRLFPFFAFDPSKRQMHRNEPSEHDLWEYLVRANILDGYFAFLKEKH